MADSSRRRATGKSESGAVRKPVASSKPSASSGPTVAAPETLGTPAAPVAQIRAASVVPDESPAASLPTASSAAAPSAPPAASAVAPKLLRRAPVVLELITFDVLKLNEVDNVMQTFKAEFLMLFQIPGGAKDEYLAKPGEKDDSGRVKFGTDADGKPACCAEWYIEQIDIHNVYDHASSTTLESKVIKRGDDLLLHVRTEGVYMVSLDLNNFPVDTQALPINIVVCCRTGGPVAVDLRLGIQTGCVVTAGFFAHQLFRLKADVDEEGQPLGVVDLTRYDHGRKGRQFPSIRASITVQRRPAFYVVNVAVPMALFSALSCLQFTMPPPDVSDRLSISLTLLLTATAYKFATASLVPAISYMTALDNLVVWNALLIAVSTVAGATVFLIDEVVDPINAAPPIGAARALRKLAAHGIRNRETGQMLTEETQLMDTIDMGVLLALVAGWLWIHLSATAWILSALRLTPAEALRKVWSSPVAKMQHVKKGEMRWMH